MKTMLRLTIVISLGVIAACNNTNSTQNGASNQPAATADDPQLASFKQSIAATTPAEKTMIDKLVAMTPEVNEQASGKSLKDVADDYAKTKGDYDIKPIGWTASRKKNGRWKLLFYYQDYTKQYLTAEWEYNPETSKLYPFDFKNAPQFWSAPETGGKTKPKKGA